MKDPIDEEWNNEFDLVKATTPINIFENAKADNPINRPEFIINTIKKEVKRDDVLVRQVFYTGISTYTFDPLNLAVLAPTSEGKTYAVMKVMKYFPKEDVWNIGAMSTKVLVRQKGILINSKGESIQEKVDKLRDELNNVNTITVKFEPKGDEVKKFDFSDKSNEMSISDKVKTKKNEIKKQLDLLLKDATKLINLQGKILIFLEPPQHELWSLLKPILSHDEVEISYPYVDKTDELGIETRNVIVRGWPACIVCSAKDESQWKIWPEIQSRFLITSPNINKDKVHEGNLLIGQRKGLPNSVQQQIIVSDEDNQKSKECVSYLKDWIKGLSQANLLDYAHPNAVWIPYYEILASALKSEKGTDNRATNRIFTLINTIALTNVNFRPNLVFGRERLVVATLQDLRETLYITQNMSGIPTHKIEFFKDIFMDLYKTKTVPNSKYDSKRDDYVYEDRIAVTTPELREYLKTKNNKVMNADSIKKTYIDELLNNAIIDEAESKLDHRQKIYFPIIEIDSEKEDEKITNYRNLLQFDNFLQYNRIILPKYYNNIPENWLKLQILDLMKYQIDGGVFQLIDQDDNETCICQFIKNYEKDDSLIRYFVEPKINNNYNKIFGEVKLLQTQEQINVENYRN